jgi:hypothetical protein
VKSNKIEIKLFPQIKRPDTMSQPPQKQPQNSFVLARNFTAETDLTLSAPVKAKVGGSHYHITSNQKPLVLILSGAEVKPTINKKGEAVLIVSQTDEVMKTLNLIRSRLVEQLQIDDVKMKPLLSTFVPKKGLAKKNVVASSTLFINPDTNATLVDKEKNEVEYETLVGKTCSMAIYLRIQSVFKHDTGSYSFMFKAGHLVLLGVEEEAVVDQIEYAPITDDLPTIDIADLL